MSTAPAMSYTPSETRGPAVIGKSVMIKGQIFSREDLTIDGEVDGSVELHEHRLTVGPNGKLQAGDLQDQFNGSGTALATQTFTLDKRIQTPPDETSIGVRMAWRYTPPGGSGFAVYDSVIYAVMRASPVLL